MLNYSFNTATHTHTHTHTHTQTKSNLAFTAWKVRPVQIWALVPFRDVIHSFTRRWKTPDAALIYKHPQCCSIQSPIKRFMRRLEVTVFYRQKLRTCAGMWSCSVFDPSRRRQQLALICQIKLRWWQNSVGLFLRKFSPFIFHKQPILNLRLLHRTL